MHGDRAGRVAAHVTRARIQALLRAVETRLAAPATLFLVGEASLVLEGGRAWTDRVVCTVESPDAEGAARAIDLAAGEWGMDVLRESPADVVPLPPGFAERARPAGEWRLSGSSAASATAGEEAGSSRAAAAPGEAASGKDATRAAAGLLSVLHFDPYSVAFRLLARGDEPDYHVVLGFLEHGLVSLETMDRLLAEVLPRFSSVTIQQDPAEFRRKYKGLRQMWLSGPPASAAASR